MTALKHIISTEAARDGMRSSTSLLAGCIKARSCWLPPFLQVTGSHKAVRDTKNMRLMEARNESEY